MRKLLELVAPAALVLGTALLGLAVSTALQTYFLDTLVKVAIVVALYVFIGNSGVLSFGHVSFVALGVWTAGVLTVPEGQKNAIMPGVAHFLLHANVGNVPSLFFAALAGLVFAFVVGPAAHAALRPRRRDRDVRRARDREQRPPLRRQDRAGAERVLVRA